MNSRRSIKVLATGAIALAAMLLSGCVAGENSQTVSSASTLNIDFATYNPLSLVIKEKGWLEDALTDQKVKVNWVQSAGSNKANEALRAGAIDVGSTAGSAALLAKANGSEIQTIDIFSQPEWAALVVPAGSPITSVADLKGKQIAATTGTDPYFFLLQSLKEAGLSQNDVTIQNLQHADGWAALQNGSVDAWAGLDPIMATAEQAGAQLLYRNVDFNSYGFLNATQSLIKDRPKVAQVVVSAYEYAREWALNNPTETAQILSKAAGIDLAVAQTVIRERTNLEVDHIPGAQQLAVLKVIGPFFVQTGAVDNQSHIDNALDTLLNDTFAKQAYAEIVPE